MTPFDIQDMPKTGEESATPPLEEPIILPTSFAQQRVWFIDQLSPGMSTFNIPMAVRFIGPLNIAALEQALNEIVSRHESLRTTFALIDDQPTQVIRLDLTLPLPVIELSHLLESERESEARRLVRQAARQPFDLTQGPLAQVKLFRLASEEHVLLVTMHHIISDGWSMDIFWRELRTLYGVFSQGHPSPLPELPIQYADFAVWQREQLQGRVMGQQLAYWRQQLAGALPVLELPTDYPRPLIQTFRGGRQTLVLSKTLTEALKALSRRERATLFMTLLAGFKLLLYRLTRQEDIIVGSPIAGRNRAELENLIGYFLNMLALRTQLSGQTSFRELLEQVRQTALKAYANQDIPFEQLLAELQPERDLSRTPLFQVLFNMLNLDSKPVALPGLTAKSFAFSESESESKFDITLYVRDRGDSLTLSMVYNRDLFAEARMAEMLAQYEYLLAQIVANPEEKLDCFSLVTDKAKTILPNPTRLLNTEWAGAVQTHFSEQARQYPAAIALIDRQGHWSYQELEATSNQLAHYLRAQHLNSQDVVAIYGHRNAALVWAILGVLKAGAAFLILDPAYPAQRLIDYVRLARPQGWLQLEAAGAPPAALAKFVTTLGCRAQLQLPQSPAKAGELLASYSVDHPGVVVGADDLAYLSFTSGSTGQPKGILGTHRPLSHFMQWHSQTFGLNSSDRFSLLSGLAHDPLLRDIFTPLWLGAMLCIPDAEDIGLPGQLAAWMRQQGITVTHLTPPMAQLLTETTAIAQNDLPVHLPALRYAFFGGDLLTKQHFSSLRRLAPEATCINFYGATETPQAMGYTIVANPVEPFQEDGSAGSKATIPIGSGIQDVQLLVLTPTQQLAGLGELGEIYIRTPYLSKGYLNDEPLTQERFIINPFTQTNSDRLYKSGDLGRYLPDGQVEFLGRSDHQVKIRGFRIELKEIEAALDQHPAIQAAVVQVREDTPGEKRLAAYVVAHQPAESAVQEWRHYLKERLPDVMIPASFTILATLPLTPNGKIDYQALPAPDGSRQVSETRMAPPRDDLETQLVQIWQEVLGVQPIGIRDSFFELGGHSLLAVRLMSQIERVIGVRLHLATLFQGPTIEQQAKIVQDKDGEISLLIPIQPNGSKHPFFCVPGGGDNAFIFTDLAHHLGPDQPFYAFRFSRRKAEQTGDDWIKDMAAQYIQEMKTLQPEGPYLLGGYCFGGPIAFEMAQQLQAQGQPVGLVAIFESYRPGSTHLPGFLPRLRHHLKRFWQLNPKRKWAYILTRVKARFLKLSRKLNPNFGRSMSQALGQTTYAPQRYPGRLILFQAAERNPELYYDPYMGWGRLASGGIDVYAIPGTHIDAYKEPNVQTWAEQMKQCLDQAQGL
jgi:amino acid adenylation domain-containing protein